ncbi:unnamed protein product [Oikopleura dioica]|uniref:Uncharacterized protein n=1 Tax=Oikopleura dioica TaxID=34765 RepID=E4YGG2_OIKDI|nr:unnamed protein product [Oikopleura dioica]
MWDGFFPKRNTFAYIAKMMTHKAENGWSIANQDFYKEIDTTSSNSKADFYKNLIGSEITDNLKDHLYWYGFDRCINKHNPGSTWHKLQMIRHENAIRGVMKLININLPEQSILSETRVLNSSYLIIFFIRN